VSRLKKSIPISSFIVFFGLLIPLDAYACADKVVFSKIFNVDDRNAAPKIKNIDVCTDGILVVTSDVPIAKIVSNEQDAVTISPVDNFTIVIANVSEGGAVVSFFSSNMQEFFILTASGEKQVDFPESKNAGNVSDDEFIATVPLLINNVNIASENLKPGDFVDVLWVSGPTQSPMKDNAFRQKLATSLKILSIEPSDLAKNENRHGAENDITSSFVYLGLPKTLISQIRRAEQSGRLILFKSSNPYLKPLASFHDPKGEVFDEKNSEELSEFGSTTAQQANLKTKQSIHKESQASERYVNVIRSASKERLVCNPECEVWKKE